MSRVPSSPPPADAPHYHYDPHLGSPRDTYKRVDFVRTRSHQPEVAGRFVAVVDGETIINSMWGRQVASPLLERLEHYYDRVRRTWARIELIGPFTIFVQQGGGFPLYARPSIGAQTFRVEDVDLVRARQRALGLPESFEWVADTTP